MCRLFIVLVLTLLVRVSIAQDSLQQNAALDSAINETYLKQLVQVLASDSMKGRFTGSEQASEAARFIADEFGKAGALPVGANNSYFSPFKVAGETGTKVGINVMATLPGNSRRGELIIFCAHYDHVGTRSTNPYHMTSHDSKWRIGDTIFNGANDNASGVAAVISLAHYFGRLKNNERTIVFIAFSGEELGMKGSQHMALSCDAGSIKAVINIEMIGRARSKRKQNAFITGDNLSDLQSLINKQLYKANAETYGKGFFEDDPFPEEMLFRRSDNFWFAHRGIPAHTFMASSPFDAFYHRPGDEPSTLDFQLMSIIVKAIALGCNPLLQGVVTPTRIKSAPLQ